MNKKPFTRTQQSLMQIAVRAILALDEPSRRWVWHFVHDKTKGDGKDEKRIAKSLRRFRVKSQKRPA